MFSAACRQESNKRKMLKRREKKGGNEDQPWGTGVGGGCVSDESDGPSQKALIFEWLWAKQVASRRSVRLD